MDIDQFKDNVGQLSFYSRHTNERFRGTATKISENYILTAAHLLFDSDYGGRSEKVIFSLFYSKKCYKWKVTSERYFLPTWKESKTVCSDYAIARLGTCEKNDCAEQQLIIRDQISPVFWNCLEHSGINLLITKGPLADATFLECGNCARPCSTGIKCMMSTGSSGGPWVQDGEVVKIRGITSTCGGGITASPDFFNIDININDMIRKLDETLLVTIGECT